MALLSERAADQALTQLQKAREMMARNKDKAKAMAEQMASGALTVGGGVVGGALDGYFPEPDKQVFGLAPSETLAVAGLVLAFSGVLGKPSEYARDVAAGTAAYALGCRMRTKAACLKAQKLGKTCEGVGASAAQLAAQLEAERRQRSGFGS